VADLKEVVTRIAETNEDLGLAAQIAREVEAERVIRNLGSKTPRSRLGSAGLS